MRRSLSEQAYVVLARTRCGITQHAVTFVLVSTGFLCVQCRTDHCQDEPARHNNGLLVPCGDDSFCCGAEAEIGACDCDSGRGTFNVGVGSLQTILGVTGTVYTQTPSITVSSLSSGVTSILAGVSSSWTSSLSMATSTTSFLRSPTDKSLPTSSTSTFLPRVTSSPFSTTDSPTFSGIPWLQPSGSSSSSPRPSFAAAPSDGTGPVALPSYSSKELERPLTLRSLTS
jgi:hypothetical protein